MLTNSTDFELPSEEIQKHILNIRGEKVMLDTHLAILYGVPTKALIQAVKRNLNRFRNYSTSLGLNLPRPFDFDAIFV